MPGRSLVKDQCEDRQTLNTVLTDYLELELPLGQKWHHVTTLLTAHRLLFLVAQGLRGHPQAL